MIAELNFVLKGAGWAELEIIQGDAKAVIPSISYCTNALDDLIRIGIDIATGKGIGAAIFDHEPALTALVAETAWIEDNEWRSGARLSVIRDLPNWVEPSFKWRASVDADLVLSVASPDDLATMFLRAAQGVLNKHGEEGYRKSWGGRMGFPMRAMKALNAALSCPSSVEWNYG